MSNQKLLARQALWRKGNLSWICHPVQKEMYDLFYSSEPNTISCWLLSRQSGKSYLLAILAIETALRNPNGIVKLVTDTKVHVKTIFVPIFRELLAMDCPDDCKPDYSVSEFNFTFPNGAQIQLAGSDGKNYERLRGQKSLLNLVDEAGFCDDLEDMVQSVLIPTTTHTGGRIVLSSTPPKEEDHPFHKFIERAQMEKRFVKKTVYENPLLTPEKIAILMKQYGGATSERWRREFCCEVVKSSDSSVLPEFTDELCKDIVKDWPKPPFFDSYESMDLGGKDLTAVLFAYYDFRAAKVIIEDELIFDFRIRGNHIKGLINGIQIKEAALWTNPLSNEIKYPFSRVSDINPIVISEISDLSKDPMNPERQINFTNANKYDKEASINDLRIKLASQKIIIHPRCETLIRHLMNVRWKTKTKDDFARSADDGHYDACFLAGSKVLTDKGYKNIEDIVQGDKVLTHQGRFRTVLNSMSKDYIGPIIKIKPDGREEIYTTPEHRFYSSETYKLNNKVFTGQRFAKDPDWISASSLNKDHRLFIPSIPEGINPITKELSFLYGYYVAEGSLGGNGHQIQFAGHIKETKVKDIIEKAVFETYGDGKSGTSRRSLERHSKGQTKPRKIKASVYNREGNARTLCITQSELYNELKKLGKSVNKQFPDFINTLSKEQAFHMLCGYLFGDGHFSKTGIISSSVSSSITDTVDLLARKCGFFGTKGKALRKGRWKGLSKTGLIANDCYTWRLDKQQSKKFIELIDQYQQLEYVFQDKLIHYISSQNKYHVPSNLFSFEKAELFEFSGKVYNLEVEEDNSYTVNDVAVHNCDALLYLIRSISYTRSPYPATYGFDSANMHIQDPNNFNKGDSMSIYRKIFNVKRR